LADCSTRRHRALCLCRRSPRSSSSFIVCVHVLTAFVSLGSDGGTREGCGACPLVDGGVAAVLGWSHCSSKARRLLAGRGRLVCIVLWSRGRLRRAASLLRPYGCGPHNSATELPLATRLRCKRRRARMATQQASLGPSTSQHPVRPQVMGDLRRGPVPPAPSEPRDHIHSSSLWSLPSNKTSTTKLNHLLCSRRPLQGIQLSVSTLR